MSSFRRAPNVSQYIANLNSISPSHESSPSDTFLNDDVDLFATTDFIDFDMGEPVMSNLPISAELASSIDMAATADAHHQNGLGFDQAHPEQEWSNDFNFSTDFSTFAPILDSQPAYPLAHPTAQRPTPLTHVAPAPPKPTVAAAAAQPTAEKRKLSELDSLPPSADLSAKRIHIEEDARLAAEEDKRRRNTAASARFRIKKKQREADLEKRAKEMTERAAMLETKVGQLEMENKWLKSLITEKNDFKGEALEGMWRKFERENGGEILEKGRTDGVGTKRAKVEV